jgi:hypothetical protein
MKDLKVVFEIILVLAVLGAISFIAYSFYKKKEAGAGDDLAKQAGVSGAGDVGDVTKKVPAKEVAKTKASVKNLDVKTIGEMIYSAKGVFFNSPSQVVGAFSKFKTRVELVDFSTYFKLAYKTDLMAFLNTFDDPKMLSDIDKIVKKLPAY